MHLSKGIGALLDNPLVYRLWQRPFAGSKMAPVIKHNDLSQVHRVLDLGCGPGTNCPYFTDAEYLGIDLNPQYIEYAERRFERPFAVEDVRSYRPPPDRPFDFVLLNSLLHHLDDEATNDILENLGQVVSDDGHIHIIELVLPPHAGIARSLALRDRGDYPRPMSKWRSIFCLHFEPVVFEPFELKTVMGITLWNLVYFKGRMRA
jgi:SAM-dependent methyltransferase